MSLGEITGSSALGAAEEFFGGGFGSFIGGILGNRSARREAQRNRDFQEYMSSTAYQRAVKDMRLAGINPMLAYMQGGASTPGGSMAPQSDVVTPAISTAMQRKRLNQELQTLWAQMDKAYSESENTRQDTKLKKVEQKLLESELPGAENEAKAESELPPEVRALRKILESVGLNVGSAAKWRARQYRGPVR